MQKFRVNPTRVINIRHSNAPDFKLERGTVIGARENEIMYTVPNENIPGQHVAKIAYSEADQTWYTVPAPAEKGLIVYLEKKPTDPAQKLKIIRVYKKPPTNKKFARAYLIPES